MSRRQFLQSMTASGMALALRPVAAAAPQPGATPSVPTAAAAPAAWRNWSGIAQCQPAAWAVPRSEEELVTLLRQSPAPLRAVGAGHSFTALVPTEGTLLSIDALSGLSAHAAQPAPTATLQAGTRLATVSRLLDGVGLALRNAPDIDAQTLAGALATATHGTGADLPALHADVQSLRLVAPTGQILSCSAQDNAEVFHAARVSLGALGVVTEMTLRVRPRHVLQRRVWLMPVDSLLRDLDTLARKHRQFECYLLPHTGYGAVIVHDEHPGPPQPVPHVSADEDVLRDLRRLRDWLGYAPSLRRWVAQRLIDPAQTEQRTDWSYRLLSTQRPTRFNETEGHVSRANGPACLRAVLDYLEQRNDVYFPVEFRYVAQDDAWLSPFYERDSCSIAVHAAHDEPWDYLVKDVGALFRRHGARPHWGKLHDRSAQELRTLYPRWNDFDRVRRHLDPQGRMLNAYLRPWFERSNAS